MSGICLVIILQNWYAKPSQRRGEAPWISKLNYRNSVWSLKHPLPFLHSLSPIKFVDYVIVVARKEVALAMETHGVSIRKCGDSVVLDSLPNPIATSHFNMIRPLFGHVSMKYEPMDFQFPFPSLNKYFLTPSTTHAMPSSRCETMETGFTHSHMHTHVDIHINWAYCYSC